MSIDGMDVSDVRNLEALVNEGLSEDSDERSMDVSCSYEDMIYKAVAPIVRKAQMDVTRKIAEKYNLSISHAEIEELCGTTPGGGHGTDTYLDGDNDATPSLFTGLKRKPSTSSSNGTKDMQTYTDAVLVVGGKSTYMSRAYEISCCM